MVGNTEKRIRVKPIEISIFSTQKLFALGKLLNSDNITGITRVKYMNSFIIIITCDGEESAAKLQESESFQEKEWGVQKTWEKTFPTIFKISISHEGINRTLKLERIQTIYKLRNIIGDIEITSKIFYITKKIKYKQKQTIIIDSKNNVKKKLGIPLRTYVT